MRLNEEKRRGARLHAKLLECTFGSESSALKIVKAFN